jgi:histone H3/H4
MDYGSIPAGVSNEAIALLENFWPRITNEIQNLTSSDFKNPELPLARIKKIMKLDDEVKMISAEAPIIFAKAAELFIQEVTIRAWLHTEENKRRTLQRNDVALAISKYDQFDFLIDIVPREEIKPTTKKESGNSPTNSNNMVNANNSIIINTNDPTSFLGAINGSTANGNAIIAAPNGQGSNVQYYFALPSNGLQNGASLPLQLQGIQTIQGIPNNIQALQGAQIILNSNGQPTLFSMGANRDC